MAVAITAISPRFTGLSNPWSSGEVTYRTLGERIRQYCQVLAGLGLTRGLKVTESDLIAAADMKRPEPLQPVAREVDIGWLAYTGDTTGRSKGVTLTHRSLIS